MDRISGLPQPIQHDILDFLEEREIGRAAVLSKAWRIIVQTRPALESVQSHILNYLDAKKIARAAVLSKAWRSIVRTLPLLESVQSHILNYLDEKEIAQAAVLSKAWRSIVHTRPVFDHRLFRRKRRSDKSTNLVSEDLCFINHVDDFFRKHDRRIHKFSLVMQLKNRYNYSCWQYLDRWIQQLVEAKVEVLCLNLRHDPIGYVFPPFVFSSETIIKLRLSECNLEQCNYMSMPNLLELSLEMVTLSQGMIDQISSGCPNLEILRLIVCGGFSSICVSGLARLYEVELNLGYGSQTDVRVVAPMLRVFKAASIAKIDLLACESTLRNLSLSHVNMTTEGLRDFVSKFHRLEELVLAELHVKSIEIPTQKFLKLEVSYCSHLEKRVRIDAPNLRVLKYDKNNFSFDQVISCISPSCKIDICSWYYYSTTSKCDIQSYRDLFRTLSGFTDVKFILEDLNGEMIVCQVLDEDVIKKINDSETTMIRSAYVARTTSHEHLADHLFDSCFGRKTTISIVSRDQQSNRKFFEVLRKGTLKEKELKPNCCRYKAYKCWRHSLYDAEMIDEEMSHWTSGTASLIRSIVAKGYQTARIKLQWMSYVR